MRPRHDARAARRRDSGLHRIRSNGDVRYPGVDLPPTVESDAPSETAADPSRLAPALDTGIEIQTRASRQQESAARRQRTVTVASVAIVALLISAMIGWRYVSDRMAAATPLTAETTAASASGSSAAVHKTSNSSQSSAVGTPIFASYGKLKLHLPVPLAHLTEIGFHQAAYAYALRLKTPMKDANLSQEAKTRSTGRKLSKQPTGPGAVMIGYVLRMWRSGRPGRPDTAADVGAMPGTTVLAPVGGTIVKIKPYLLYGKYPDYEVHIHPDGTDGLDLVMIHLTNLSCQVGEHVDAGVTPIAKVRKLSDKFYDQLASYTRGGGDHVHIQINDANYRGYKGLVGAISVPASGSTGSATSAGAAAGTTDGKGADDTDDSGSSD